MNLSAEAMQGQLAMLADAGQNGATEALLLAHGFWHEMLAELVATGLATARRESMKAGRKTIAVERYRITDTGRSAIEE